MSRATSFSEFKMLAPTSFMTRMQSQNVAKKLLNSRQARNLLPTRRMPTYPEFRRLMKEVYSDRSLTRDAKEKPAANMESIYLKLVEMRQAQFDRKHLKGIKSVINTRQPNTNSLILERTSVLEDLQKKQDIFRHNLQMLKRINRTQRLHGVVNCFNTTHQRGPSGRHRERVRAERLSRANRDLGCRLAMVKSKVDCYNPWVPPLPPMERRASQQTLVKYTPFIPAPQTAAEIDPHALLRPVLYYDLVEGDNQPLGRISIQLYTEVSPEVVLEFVRLATYNDVQGHRFLRIFADLWMEGELVLGSRDALRRHHSTKRSQLDHTRLTGFLSYAWDYHHHFPQGLLNYTISFKPLAVQSLHRIVFGRVFGGHRVLQLCQAFGTKNGKPKSPVTITQCGLL